MSAKTKIVVLRMKEVIYTGIFAALGILLLVLLLLIFLPKKEENATPAPDADAAPAAAQSIYIPGIYTTELILGGHAVDIQVIVEANTISSLQMGELSAELNTLYPLLAPTFEALAAQIQETQSLENISYTPESKYTSLVLLEAIGSSLEKAMAAPAPGETAETSVLEELDFIESSVSQEDSGEEQGTE